MTDITPMPNNAENYYRKAMNALKLNEIEKGMTLLEKSFKIDNTLPVFEELVKLYVFLNSPTDLDRVWTYQNYSIKDIATSNRLTELFSQSIPIMNPTYEGLNKLYQLKDLNPSSSVTEYLKVNINSLLDRLKVEESINKLDSHKAIEQYSEQLLTYTQFEVLSKLKIIYQTNSDKTIELLKELLKETQLLNFIKNDILHYLITKNNKEELTINWFGQTRQVEMNSLFAYKNSKFYQNGLLLIEDYFAQKDPHLAKQIIEIFNLHAMVLYPFYEEAIESPQTWLELTLSQYGLLEDSDSKLQVSPKELNYYRLAQNEFEQLFH